VKPIVLCAIGGLILLAGLAIGWQVKPVPPPTYRDVVVHDSVIVQQAPDTVLRFVDRIKWKVLEPTVVARGDQVDTLRLQAYCAPIIPNSISDSGNAKPAPVLPPSSGKYDGKTLKLFSVTSDSRLFAQETQVTAPFEWVNRGGVYEVRTERAGFKLPRLIPRFLLPFAAGVGAGIILSK
jgi:hypothetical protein